MKMKEVSLGEVFVETNYRQLELNLLDAVQVEELQPKEETWEEGIMLETVDGTDN